MLIWCGEDLDVFLLGGVTVQLVQRHKTGVLRRKSSSCFSFSSLTFPDCCIFISTGSMYVHVEKDLSPFLQKHPLFLKKYRFALRCSPRAQFQNKFAITVLSYLIYYVYFGYCFLGSSKNINRSWDLGDKFTRWNKMREFQPATEFRISLRIETEIFWPQTIIAWEINYQ